MQALNKNASTAGAWDAIHALSYHTYTTNFESIVNETTSLYEQFGKPIWVTEIASGSNSTMEANIQLMEAFVPWANNQSWIERYFWNQAVSSPVVLWCFLVFFGTEPSPGSLSQTASKGMCVCALNIPLSQKSDVQQSSALVISIYNMHVVAPVMASHNCLWSVACCML